MIKNKYTKLVAAMAITLFAGAAQAAYVDIAVNGSQVGRSFQGHWELPDKQYRASILLLAPTPLTLKSLAWRRML